MWEGWERAQLSTWGASNCHLNQREQLFRAFSAGWSVSATAGRTQVVKNMTLDQTRGGGPASPGPLERTIVELDPTGLHPQCP